MSSSIQQKIIDIISNKVGIPVASIQMSSNLMTLCGSEMVKVEVFMEVERECNTKIPDSAMPKIITVGDLVNYIEQHFQG